ncbi:MAG: hypothetical protein AAGI51_10090, partial [Pseudomonadota bacterium]
WRVWTDWYQARLDGDPIDWELERARLQPPEVWEAGPKVLNTAIAERMTQIIAEREAAERIVISETSGRLSLEPPSPEQPEVLANAVSLVEDALADFHASGAGNRAFALRPALDKLTRALDRYADNALRLHDDFCSVARRIARETSADPDLGEMPAVADLQETVAQAAIDIRIAVKAVSDHEAARNRRLARKPSANARSAVRRLLDERGEAFDDALRDDTLDRLETVEQDRTAEGEPILDQDAKDDAHVLSERLARLYRLSRAPRETWEALATRAGRTADDIEWLISLLRGFEQWRDVIELILRGG